MCLFSACRGAAPNLSRFFRCKSGFLRDRGGVAAIEFALVFPLLIVFLTGSLSLYDGLRGSRVYGQAATTVSDLVTRQTAMSDALLTDMFATAEALTGQYSRVSDYRISITSVVNEFDSRGNPDLSIGWSRGNVSGAALTLDDLGEFDLPDLFEGESVILVVMSGTYTPFIWADAVGQISYQRHSLRRPRFIPVIQFP